VELRTEYSRHIAIMARDVEMTRHRSGFEQLTRNGIWPNRDATSGRTIADERGYVEMVSDDGAGREGRRERL
jgi:hypothetical protein